MPKKPPSKGAEYRRQLHARRDAALKKQIERKEVTDAEFDEYQRSQGVRPKGKK
jgi:hypothetical protein